MSAATAAGQELVRQRKATAGIDATAVDVFTASYRTLASGATGMVPESSIAPLDGTPSLGDLAAPADGEALPPSHGDLYTVLHASGLLGTLLEGGFTQLFVSNSDNLAAVPDPHLASWFATSGTPFAVEAVRRTAGGPQGRALRATSQRRADRAARDGADPARGSRVPLGPGAAPARVDQEHLDRRARASRPAGRTR